MRLQFGAPNPMSGDRLAGFGSRPSRLVPWFFEKIGTRVSEPEIKLVVFFLLGVGGLAAIAKSEALLPAYLIGMVLAPTFVKYHVGAQDACDCLRRDDPVLLPESRLARQVRTVLTAAGMIGVYLGMKMLTKFVGILPLTKVFRFDPHEGMYTTLLMCTGADLRQYLGPVRTGQPHHRSESVHDPRDRRDPQRRRA